MNSKKKKDKPKNESMHSKNQKLKSGETGKANKADKCKKDVNANEKSVISGSKKQKSSCAIKQKKLSEESVHNQETNLFSYKKKDLSEVNYFILKKNKEADRKSTGDALPELSAEESCQNVEPPKSFWNQRADDIENGFRQIMIEEKRKKNRPGNPNQNGDLGRKYNSTKCLQDSKSSYRNHNLHLCRALSLEENSIDKNLTDIGRSTYRNSTNFLNKSISNLSDLQMDMQDRKYSLDEFLVESKKTKEKSKTEANKWKNENENVWKDIKLDQNKHDPPAAVKTWLQDNEICLDQIMIEEKIKQRAATKKTYKTSSTESKILPKIKTKHGEYKTRSESYHDETDFSQKDIRVPSRTYSLDHLLQSDWSSEISDEWFRDNKICLDQIIIEERIKRNLQKTKTYSETSSEESYYKNENENVWKDIKLDQNKLDPPAAVKTWHQIMMEEKIKQRAATKKTYNTPSTESKILPKIKTKHGEYKTRSESYHDETDFSQKDIRVPSRRYSLDHLLQRDWSSEVSDDWFRDKQICLDQIIIEERIKRNLQKTKTYLETSSEEAYYKPEHIFSRLNITKRPLFLHSLMRAFQIHNTFLRSVPYLLTKLDKTSEEFHDVSRLFFKTVQSYKIDCIKKMVNPYLLLHYNLKKATIGGEERTLFHGTRMENVEPICTENFDWRQVERHKYGWGVSFSNSAYYASHYSDQSASTMAMFVVKVLVGKEWFGDCDMEVPEEPHDTTINLDGKVYVKFDDCCFYPAYVIFYKNNIKRKF